MLGRLNSKVKKATIVGGGFSGLLSAYHLDRLGFEVTLFESTNRFGGLIRTDRTPLGMVERAAHSFLASPPVLKLCEDLNVELSPVHKSSKARFILRDGKMSRFPLKIHEALKALYRAGFSKAPKSSSQQTMEDWAIHHLGPAALNYLLNPFLTGIYGALPSEIGVNTAFPSLQVKPGESFLGSRFKNRPKQKKTRPLMMAPTYGMGTLTEALESHLRNRRGVRMKDSSEITSLPTAENLILSLPAYEASRLLKPSHAGLARSLAKVKYTPLITVTAFVNKYDLAKRIRGVGVLVPQIEKRKILGILFNSSSFPGRVTDESTLDSFTIMIGGSNFSAALKLSDSEIKRLISTELASILKLRAEPVHLEIQRWEKAIPQYSPEIEKVWNEANQSWCADEGHVLFANYTGQVSLRGMIEVADRTFSDL